MPADGPSRSLLDKVAQRLKGASGDAPPSILTAASVRYGGPIDVEDVTQPTGFDPMAAVLFEAVVEGAYLVANADGDFDSTEREAFEHVVLSACGGNVSPAQLRALLSDLEDLRTEDGAAKRVRMIARSVPRPEQRVEVLRVAALIAQVSLGVSDVERAVLDQMSSELGLGPAAVDEAIAEAVSALSD